MKRLAPILVAALALTACKPPPPPAPEGLDASAAYMVREFYSDDATFAAGLLGFMNWFEDEGHELIGAESMEEGEFNEAFTVGQLTDEDVANLPLEHGRTIGDAAGIVSVAEMDCSVTESEDLLVRADQDTLFIDDWEGYERTFVSSRSEYQDATRSGEFSLHDEALDRFGDDFDPAPGASTFLLTDNMVNPAPIFGGLADLDSYPMALEFRHGNYDIDGEILQIYSIITWIANSASGPAGNNHIHQSYSIEINAERPSNGKTLRMLAVWAEPEGAGLEPDDPVVLNYAVTKSAGASARLTQICNGEVEVDDEP
ncbi:MAG: hypothetical protein GY898_30750 [Proteobacteria bacterium]|nr:hypothetical protein [Pseudomonadota bacterium]